MTPQERTSRNLLRSQVERPYPSFIQSLFDGPRMGFVTEGDLPRVIAEDRFCQLLVRTGRGRFTVSAQDCEQMIETIERGGDWVRDVSVLRVN